MSIDAKQLRALISDVLKSIDLYSKAAVELLMLTSAVEAHCGSYIEQVGGPALGIFQMEPATHDDIWNNYLIFHNDLFNKVIILRNGNAKLSQRANLSYQIAMARVHYLRVKEALPHHTDIPQLARYWKQYYNTNLGKGTKLKAINKYNRYAV